MGIHSVEDLLTTYPRKYVDRSRIVSIADAEIGETVTIEGAVLKSALLRPKPRMSILQVDFEDSSGVMRCTWFNQPFRARDFVEGRRFAISGKVDSHRGHRQLSSPSYERLSERLSDADGRALPSDETVGTASLEIGRVVPVYPASAEINTALMRRLMSEAVNRAGEFADPLGDDERAALGVVGRTDAIRNIHFPGAMSAIEPARRRLVVDEVLRLQTALAMRKQRYESDAPGISHPGDSALAARLIESLPYRLTDAQVRVIGEIDADMASGLPMHRMLQGEVGSGKTVVAAAALCGAVAGGHQGALMAPTEVLADQHYLGIRGLLESIGVRVALLTGSVTGAERKRVLAEAMSGQIDVVVGTHALVHEGLAFRALGLAVVDEQHRFGVHQRVALRERGHQDETPDMLIMTATPIPRTLAITLYGDLDISILDEMPPGRLPVETRIIRSGEREQVYAAIQSEVASGRRAFIVCPLVEESPKLAATAAQEEFERLRTGPLSELSVGLLHGRMRAAEKERAMEALRSGEIDVLVATTVIEVGVDVPEASLIAVESAERFGISQLHQLRGRVGRGDVQSYCFLISDATEDDAAKRLEAVVLHSDGFVLAEEDLRLRGEGSLFGSRQAGRSDLLLTRLLDDLPLIVEVRKFAQKVVAAEPQLASHPLLRAEADATYSGDIDWLSRA